MSTISDRRKSLDKYNNSNSSIKKKRKKITDINYGTSNNNNSSSTIDNLTNQTVNYATRLEAINADGKDTRNPLEKLLNLPEDQNFLFDIGELLDRPFNAIKGGIQEAQEGGSVLEGLGQGISGEKTYYAGDILRNAGVSDDALFTNPLNGEDVSISDIAGTVLDIFADPTTYIPVAGGIAKGVNVTSKAGKAAKALKTVDKASDALSALKKVDTAVDTLSDAEKAYNAVKIANATSDLSNARRAYNTAQNAYDLAKAMPAPRMSLQDAAVSALAGGVKKVASKADDLITGGLKLADNNTLNRMLKGGASAEDITKFKRATDIYNDAKNSIRRTVNYGNALPGGTVNKIRNADNAADALELETASKIRNIRNNIDNYVSKGSNEVFNSRADVEDAIQAIYSKNNKSQSTNLYDFFNDAANSKKGTASITGNYKRLQKIANNINSSTINGKRMGDQIKLTVTKTDGKQGKLVLSGIKNKGRTDLKNVVKNADFEKYLRAINVRTPIELKNNKSVRALSSRKRRINEYVKQYNSDKKFRKIYDDALKVGQNYVDELYKRTGRKVDFSEIWNKEGYLPKGLTENLSNNKNKAFSTAKYGNVEAGTANIIREDKRLKALDDVSKRIESKTNSLNKRERIGEQINSTKAQINERKQISESINKIETGKLSDNELSALKKSATDSGNRELNRALKIKDNQIKNNTLLKNKKAALDGYTDNISPSIMKKITNSNNTPLAKSYLSEATTYNSTLKQASSLEKKIVNASKKGEDVSKMSKQLEDLYSKAAKHKNSLDIKRAKIEGSLTDSMVNKMQKAVNDTKKLDKNIANLEKRQGKLKDSFDSVKQANNDMIAKLDKKLNGLTIEYENLDPNFPENIAKNKTIREDITKLERQKEYLESQAGKELFSTSYFDGLTNFMERTNVANKELVGYSNILLETGLNDDSVVRFISKEGITKGMLGAKRLSKEEASKFVNYLNINKNLLSDDLAGNLDTFKKALKESNGIYIDKTAYEMLTRNKFTEKYANAFVDSLNKINDTFKTFSTVSPGFHMRNVVGNTTNMALSGIPLRKIPGELLNANRILKSDYMWDLLTNGAKNSKQAADLKLINQFIDAGFLGQGKEVRDLQSLVKKFGNSEKYKSTFKKIFSKVFDANVKANEFIDSRTRMAILSYADKNPSYIANLGLKTPTEVVRFVAMDPANMSPFEKNVLKKIVPFYTFTKQNLYFQSKNILRNPSKYKNLLKALDLSYESAGEGSYRDYQKDSMQIPLYKDENGNLVTLKSNLPVSDLGEFIENPLQRLVSSTSPLIRTPFEAVTGVDTFTGEESNKSGLDYLAGILGLSNVVKVPGRLRSISPENTASQNLSNLFGSVFSYNDADKIAMSDAYEEMEEYQNYINELKAQGINVPTLAELEEQGIDVDAIKERIAEDDSMLRRLKRARQRIQKSLGN